MARRKKKFKFTWKLQILAIMILLCCILFSAVSMVMIVGMVPTVVAAIADRSKGRVQTISVGSVNFAGCLPFMLDVFHKGNSIPAALHLITEPRTIVMMYIAAGAGYLIDWSLTGIVSSVMVQKAKARIKHIEKQQAEMVLKWGQEVTGSMPLDDYGFPKDGFTQKPNEANSV